MNAPTPAAHLAPVVQARPVPQAFLDALKARFGDNCSTALVIREQHGRDESAFAPVPRLPRWSLPSAHKMWQMQSSWPANTKSPSFHLA